MNAAQLQFVDESLLPLQMRGLIKIIGLPQTLVILKRHGGRSVRFPTTSNGVSKLEKLLSPESISKLCQSDLAGLRCDLPKLDKAFMQIRNMEIIALRGQCTKTELSERYDLTTRMIQVIWNEEQEENPTMDMFS